MEEASELLKEYQQTKAVGMNIVSREEIKEQYQAETRSSAVIGYAISFVVALVGILNFINSMVTAIISRKKEFAMIQSVGMTKWQLRRMLTFEGLYYAGITLAVSYVLGLCYSGDSFKDDCAGQLFHIPVHFAAPNRMHSNSACACSTDSIYLFSKA